MTKFSKSAIAKMGAACLALGLSLSSCSREEVQVAPEAGAGKAKVSEANMKVSLPNISPSNLPVGQGSPGGGSWNLIASEFGISDCKNYLGNITKPWNNLLPIAPSGSTRFVTLKLDNSSPGFESGQAFGQVGNLVVGQKYKITYNVFATGFPGQPTPSSIVTALFTVNESTALGPGAAVAASAVNLAGKWNKWVPATLIFVAQKTSYHFDFSPLMTGGAIGQCAVNLDIKGIEAIRESVSPLSQK